jgi:iron complex outermembrane receptor protein
MAQNKTITGKVTDRKDGSPIIGASIKDKNSSAGASTGGDGSFRINIPESATALVVSYVGYTNQEVSITGKTSINVSLAESATTLSEVVVSVGYGTQRVKDATGSVASLGTKQFNKGVIATPEQLLQGRIAGVQVTPASGEPGAGATINIRGTGSIRAGNGPLYVVDGVPLDGGGTSGGIDAGAGSSSARNPLAFINPADIENISVLKDASASAIYGSRGANGVVLITTKKGTSKQGVQFSAATSMSSVAKRYDLLNTSQFLTAVTAAGGNSGLLSAGGVNFGGNTDWQNEIFRTGIAQNYNLSFGGATPISNYRASFGYDDQNGTVKNSGLKRMSGRINASRSLFKERLKLDLTFLGSNVKNQFAPITNNAGFTGSLIGAALQSNPTYPVRNADNTFFSPGGDFRNAVSMLELIDDKDNINRYLTNFGTTLKLVKGLSYKGTYGYDNSKAIRSTWFDPNLPGYTGGLNIRGINVNQVSGNGRAVIQTVKLSSYITEQTLTYVKELKEAGQLEILGGYSYQIFDNKGFNDLRYDTQTKNVLVKDVASFKQKLPIFGDSTRSELQSYFGRGNYNFKDKYLLTATVRVDGSSKFGENNKYATFPALAAKWKMVNEGFGLKKFFEDFSLRLNYGKTGNQEFPAYASLAIQQANLNGGSTTITAASPNLKWETSTQYGAGIDFALIGNKLSGSIDYFNKSTKDQLFLQDYAQPAAVNRRWVNLPGSLRNTGVEVSLNLNAIKKQKFTWDVLYNMTFIKNRVEDFGNRNVITGNIDGQGLSGAYAQFIGNGYPISSFRVPVFAGFDKDGFGIYPNGEIGSVVGSAEPTFNAGLTNNFTFGKFNASFFIYAKTGFYIYNNTANAFFLKGNLASGRNVNQEVANSSENPGNSGEVSTRFVEKGDFLRLSNASLGYTFNTSSIKSIKTLRLSLAAQNLLLITNYSGLDPEINTDKQRNGVPSKGIDYTAYPSARTFTLGLSAGF